MIQRIQSIYLFLASLGFLGQFGTDFAQSDKPIPKLMADNIYEVQDSPILLGITILGALLGLIAIFLYNNRPLQSKLSIGVLTLSILLPLAAIFLIYNERTGIQDGAIIKDTLGIFLPIVSAIFSILANRSINKDEKLVRSMDRLR